MIKGSSSPARRRAGGGQPGGPVTWQRGGRCWGRTSRRRGIPAPAGQVGRAPAPSHAWRAFLHASGDGGSGVTRAPCVVLLRVRRRRRGAPAAHLAGGGPRVCAAAAPPGAGRRHAHIARHDGPAGRGLPDGGSSGGGGAGRALFVLELPRPQGQAAWGCPCVPLPWKHSDPRDPSVLRTVGWCAYRLLTGRIGCPRSMKASEPALHEGRNSTSSMCGLWIAGRKRGQDCGQPRGHVPGSGALLPLPAAPEAPAGAAALRPRCALISFPLCASRDSQAQRSRRRRTSSPAPQPTDRLARLRASVRFTCPPADAAGPSGGWDDMLVGEALQRGVARHCSLAARRALLLGPPPSSAPTIPGMPPSSAASHDPADGVAADGRGAGAGGEAPPGLVLVVASAPALADVCVPVGRCFTHQLALGAPDAHEHVEVLREALLPPPADHGIATGEPPLTQVRRRFQGFASGLTHRCCSCLFLVQWACGCGCGGRERRRSWSTRPSRWPVCFPPTPALWRRTRCAPRSAEGPTRRGSCRLPRRRGRGCGTRCRRRCARREVLLRVGRGPWGTRRRRRPGRAWRRRRRRCGAPWRSGAAGRRRRWCGRRTWTRRWGGCGSGRRLRSALLRWVRGWVEGGTCAGPGWSAGRAPRSRVESGCVRVCGGVSACRCPTSSGRTLAGWSRPKRSSWTR